MRMKNYGKGLCSCCAGNTRPLWGTDQDVTRRRYCAPCWNTMGCAPTAKHPYADDSTPATIHARMERGWARLVAGS